MKRRIYLFGCLLGASLAFGQQTHDHDRCGTDTYYQQQMHQDPSIRERAAKFEADYQLYMEEYKTSQKKAPEKFIIPIVFHVFHAGGIENISYAQIKDQIDTLNRAFNGPKFEKTREIFWGVAADCEIEFRLATLDPNGNCTDGVVRIYAPETENATNNIKLKSAWPTDRYFNIWVVKDINRAFQQLGTVLGYAQFPWVGGAQTDGVVIRHDNVGSIGTAVNPAVGVPQWGSTLVHEAGHWLGLYHPFQDSCFGGDQVDDTPPVMVPNFNCDYNSNSCDNDDPDLPDMIENYMDYSHGSCMGLFTIGQKLRMHATLKNWRPKLWLPSNLVATGTQDPYVVTTCTPKAYFFTTTTSICESGSIAYTNNTYNAIGGITYQWTFEGADNPNRTDISPNNVTYSKSGYYDVTLIATNSAGSDTFTRKQYIEVYAQDGQFGAGLSEGFEFEVFPINNWKVSSTSGVNFRRINTGVGSIGEGQHAIYVRNSEVEAGARFWLESPTVNYSGIDVPVLSFYYANTSRKLGNTTYGDALVIHSSTDCGKTWALRSQILSANISTTGGPGLGVVEFVPNGPDQWKKVDVNLSAIPVGQRNNVKIRFEFRSNGGHNFYIDDINLGFSTGIESLANETNFVVYPNPSAGATQIRVNMPAADHAKIEILDLYGRTVSVIKDGTPESGEQLYTFTPNTDLKSGMYIVRLTVDGQSFTRKLMLIQGN